MVAGLSFLLGLLVMALVRGRYRLPVIAVVALTATVLLSTNAFAHGARTTATNPSRVPR